MLSQKLKPQTIEDYIAGTPEEVQKKLYQLLACIRKAAPGATESLKWRMPAFSKKRYWLHLPHLKIISVFTQCHRQ